MLHAAQSFRLPFRPSKRFLHSTARKWQDDNLKILFCGTDLFSVAHLHALHEYQQSGQSNIASIDVVTKTDKRTGRGLKTISSPPTKRAALEYGYPVHQIDTFTGWTPPDINLVIAVAFGLLIPARIIRGSRYGGLNVHPSLLPDLRGAAPVQWAIIHGRIHTGVSIQTLHETKFDHGKVLLQSEPIDIPENASTAWLRGQLEKIGAALLVESLRSRLYLPSQQSQDAGITADLGDLVTAPKIKDEHKLVDFQTMKAEEVDRRSRALGLLHAYVYIHGVKQRMKLSIQPRIPSSREEMPGPGVDMPVGVPFVRVRYGENLVESSKSLDVKAADGGLVEICRITLQGLPQLPAVQTATRANLFDEPTDLGDCMLYRFRYPVLVN